MFTLENQQKYYTAKEARKVAEDIHNKVVVKELDYVYDQINKAKFAGEMNVTIYDKDLLLQTIEFLRAKGFKVEHYHGDQRDPYNDTIISW